MTNVYYVDFKEKKLLFKKEITTKPKLRSLEKKKTFSELMENGLTQVFVNTNCEGVKLPDHMIGSPAAKINWSYKYNLSDFNFDEFKISGTLSFNKNSFFVELPWESVWLMFRPDLGEKSTKIWPEDTPKIVLEDNIDL